MKKTKEKPRMQIMETFGEKLRMAGWYWKECENLEYYESEWRELLPELQVKYPALVKAWNDLKIAKYTVGVLLEKALDENPVES